DSYDIGQFAAWAGSRPNQQYSTAYWAWNPATVSSSNQSALEILNSYNSPTLHKVNKVALKVLKVLSSPIWGLPYLLVKGVSLAAKYVIACCTKQKHSLRIQRILGARRRAMGTIYKE